MSAATMFSITTPGAATRPPRRSTWEQPNEWQGDGSGPQSPSNHFNGPSKRKWLCDDEYQYNKPEDSKNPLQALGEYVETNDQKLCRELKEEITFLMVVAGLFLAIVTAFAIQSYQLLQENPQDTISGLLSEVVQLPNNTNAQRNPMPPTPFTPHYRDILVNQLWYSSITLSLVAVVTGTFCLQWISAFSPLRQLRFEGLVGWGIFRAPELLLFMVQISIGLFTIGLIIFLWNINHRATIPALVMTSIAGALLLVANSMPFLQSLLGLFFRKFLMFPQCPYKSPTSWLVQGFGALWPPVLKRVLKSEAIAKWCKGMPQPFTDFGWKKHDLMCAGLREPSHGGDFRLRYFGMGFLSAVDSLVYDEDTMFTIGRCLEALLPIFSNAQDWEIFSQDTRLSHDERGFLDDTYRIQGNSFPEHLRDLPLQLKYMLKIRADFIKALTLQYLTHHNQKLTNLLFRQRVELYIRVKNSITFIETRGNITPDFGNSLRCPLHGHKDVGNLSPVLKFQFLSCAKHLIGLRRATDNDILSAAAICLEIPAAPGHIQDSPAYNTYPASGPTDMNTSCARPEPGQPHAQSTSLPTIPETEDTNNPSALPKSPTESPPLDDWHERDKYGSIDPQPMAASLETLRLEVGNQLMQLRESDFNDVNSYIELRQVLDLSIEVIRRPEDTSLHGGISGIWQSQVR